jgi:hydroxyacylglutathione hydrolase
MPLAVTAIPCLSDNYIWLLQDQETGAVALCDPGEAGPAIAAVEKLGRPLDLILLTHHHGDHVAGVAEVQARCGGRVVGAAADAHRLPKLDLALRPGETVALGGSRATVIDTPGHTVGHIAFHFGEAGAGQADVLLCGDTLFSLGCGRLLEGNAAQMFQSLAKLAALPAETLVCCGHEYTLSNARFALTVESDNAALRARAEQAKAQIAAGRFTVPTTMAEERAINPFLRAGDVAGLAAIRSAKDSFR